MRALVLEGGGMRAAYTNGVLAAFEDAGVPSFDAVYGTSAGGALAAWFSARQARFALSTWRYAADPRILSWRRFLTGRGPLLDHDALYDIVYAREHPLDVESVARASHPVIVTATNADSGETIYKDLRKGPVLSWLRATGRLPLASNEPVVIDGARYLDGGINDPVPVARAIADGARDIVLVLNSPPGWRLPESRLVSHIVARRFPRLRENIMRHHELHNRAIALARSPPAGVRVAMVRPRRDLGVRRLTRDAAKLDAAIAEGLHDGALTVAAMEDTRGGMVRDPARR